MATVTSYRCDQCGLAEASGGPAASWIHVEAEPAADAMDERRAGRVRVSGRARFDFHRKDFCSPTCAGAFFGGIPAGPVSR